MIVEKDKERRCSHKVAMSDFDRKVITSGKLKEKVNGFLKLERAISQVEKKWLKH